MNIRKTSISPKTLTARNDSAMNVIARNDSDVAI